MRSGPTAPTTKENARHSRNWQSNSIIAIPKRSTVARSAARDVVCGMGGTAPPSLAVNNGRKKKLDEILVDAPTEDGDESYRISISA